MVGKARGTVKGEGRSSSGEASSHPNAMEQDILDDDLSQVEQGTEEMQSFMNVVGAMPDLTGRGTPPEKIAPTLKQGTMQSTEEEPGIGAGTSNLGVTHGRTKAGGDIAGAGASRETSHQPDTDENRHI